MPKMSITEPPHDQTVEPAVEEAVTSAVHGIRGALVELFGSIGVDAMAPQTVSRTVGINRNLAWKLSKIIGSDEPLTAVEHLPGGSGLDIMLRAFTDKGASRASTENVRAAMQSFESTVSEHVGDRPTLELMLGHMLPRHLQTDRAEAARKLAFRGNSAIWGIQADVRLSGLFLAPNADDPSRVDIATIGGLVGYRRLRPGTSWPLMTLFGYEDDGSSLGSPTEALDPTVGPNDPPLLRSYCTGFQPPIVEREVPGGVQYELGEGPLGNHGRVTSIFGTLTRAFASVYRDESNEHGEQKVNWFTPATVAMADMIVHRDLPFPMPPTLSVSGRMTPTWGNSVVARDREILSLPETVQHLGAGPPVLATPLVADYANLTAEVFDRLKWDPKDFSAYRLIVRYPPIPSSVFLSFPLAERNPSQIGNSST